MFKTTKKMLKKLPLEDENVALSHENVKISQMLKKQPLSQENAKETVSHPWNENA